MAKIIKRGLNTPTNTDCLNMETPPEELRTGSECEREITGNDPLPEPKPEGQVVFVPEGEESSCEVHPEPTPAEKQCTNQDRSGYHRTTVADFFRNTGLDGKCVSPYSRGVLGGRSYNEVIRDREEMLLQAVGQPVGLLRRQNNGVVCPCYDENRGQSRSKCEICYGAGFVPGYIYYVNEKDPLGRILLRIDPYTEELRLQGEGRFQEVQLNGWTLAAPIIRQRDVLISYTPNGVEEWRWEVMQVTRNNVFNGVQGAQRLVLKRIDPLQTIYKLDIYKIPDLKDIQVDVSSVASDVKLNYEGLGQEDDGRFPNVVVEGVYGDAAFAYMYTEGYKVGYEKNFERVVDRKEPLYSPYIREDGTIDDGYGPIFLASNGKPIRFSTPQKIEENRGINPLEVVQAEKKRLFLKGFVDGARDALKDAENYLREKGQLW